MRCCHRFFLDRFILPFEAIVSAMPVMLLLLYTGRSQASNGELGRNAERCFRHQLRVMS
jgi:hypothetical protein